MEKNIGLIEYQKNETRIRRIRQQAIAILQRAKEAGIPENQMRVNEFQLKEILDSDYFKYRQEISKNKKAELYSKNIDLFCKELFTNPDALLKPSFILIDGGNMYSRKKAGFALLFRMLGWDRSGKHYSCANVAHSLQMFKSIGDVPRNDFALELKEQDILFISECEFGLFKPTFEVGSFFDEIIEYREAHNRPTIFSFVNPIPLKGYESKERCSDLSTGQYMMMFSESDSGDYSNQGILRIRTKNNG